MLADAPRRLTMRGVVIVAPLLATTVVRIRFLAVPESFVALNIKETGTLAAWARKVGIAIEMNATWAKAALLLNFLRQQFSMKLMMTASYTCEQGCGSHEM